MKRWHAVLAGLLMSMLPWAVAADGIISTRAELLQMLGSSTTDDFETLDLVDNGTINTGLTSIDNESMVAGQGPNLVHSGVTYTSIRGPLTWVGANFQDLPMSKTLIAWNQSVAVEEQQQPLLFFAITLKYATPPQAFGIDMLRFGEVGQLTVEVYNTNDAFGEEFLLPTPLAGDPMFFGYWREGGITDVVVKNTLVGTIWSPNIDNHTYGLLGATPVEPTTWGRVKSLYR